MSKELTIPSKSLGVQESLSLGYIYLLILGVIHNAIYYSSIGINYFEYSSVLDVLISPIIVITSSFKTLIAFLCIVIISIVYMKVVLPFLVKSRRKKQKYQSGKHLEKLNTLESFTKSNFALLFIMSLFFFGFFIGIGQGKGMKNKTRIAENTIEHNAKIDFINGKSIEARLMGKNSLNIFYIQKGDKTVSISPIDGNIMKVQKLPKED